MTSPAIRRWDRETLLVAGLAVCLSIISFVMYYRRGEILLYGDAVAHINIARRVFDSQTPGLLQLGTVWLPLPHLLMVPFLLCDDLWKSGIGGSIPSLVAYVLSVIGIFRLVRGTLSLQSTPSARERIAAWAAAVIYATNPNLIYLQTTAMTEALYLAFFIWALVFFAETVQENIFGDSRKKYGRLIKCGLCLAGASLTRYDGWFLSVAMCALAVLVVWKISGRNFMAHRGLHSFVLIAATVPVLWIAYNTIVYRNPLEFANGPYSAKGIDKKAVVTNYPPHPGSNNLSMAANYFLKSAEMNFIESNWHRLWLALAFLGTVTVVLFDRRLWSLLLLWAPLPFYMLSIAYSGVPIFLPPWWPHSIYNARYGVELLPAFAVFVALVAFWLLEFIRGAKARVVILTAVSILVAASYTTVWRDQPISFREGWINSRTRIALETELATRMNQFPPSTMFLMYLGNHAGAAQQAGIPLRRIIYEGNHRTWNQPQDPDGLWERALADPAQYADIVIAADGDAVALGAQKQQLHPLQVIDVSSQPRVTIYQARKAHP